MMDKEQEKRFFEKVNKVSNGCWEWTGALRSGYGAFKMNGKVHGAHRVSYVYHNKELIPKDILVCHSCDNRKCVNPDHFFIGTHKDNMQDCLKKGRLVLPKNRPLFKKGNIPHNRILKTEDEILSVKKSVLNRKCSLKQLSIELKLPHNLLKDISCGKVYK